MTELIERTVTRIDITFAEPRNGRYDLVESETRTVTVSRWTHDNKLRWRFGTPVKRSEPPTTPGPPRPYNQDQKADITMNLGDNQQVVFTVSGSDAAGNAVTPAALTVTSSDETILTVADNGDGSYTAAATGTLGSATITAQDTETDGDQFSGTAAVDVVPEGVATIDLAFQAPTEKTPAAPVTP